MDLSIIIVSWNTKDLLDQCLRSVCDTVDGLDFEVIVVDNDSSDGSPEMVRSKYPLAKVISNNTNVGFAAANNQAYRESSGEFVLLLNPDTIVHSEAIMRLVQFLREQGKCAAVAPKLLWEDGTLQPSVGYFPSLRSEMFDALYLTRLGRVNRPSCLMVPCDERACAVQWASGACLLIRRAALPVSGEILDERYFIFSEEADLCRTFADAGWSVFLNPLATITHLGSASTSQVQEKMLGRLYESKFLFFGKHCGRFSANLYRYGILTAHVAVRIIGYGVVRLLRGSVGNPKHTNPSSQMYLLRAALGWRLPAETRSTQRLGRSS